MRVAIVGGPGIGKSTLLRQLGDLYRNGAYGEGEGGVWDPRVLLDIEMGVNAVGVTRYFAELYDANYRDAIVKRLLRVLVDPGASPREVTAAAKALMAAEAQNQADEHKVIDVSVSTRHDRLDEIAADLGIEVSVIESAAGKTDSSIEATAGG